MRKTENQIQHTENHALNVYLERSAALIINLAIQQKKGEYNKFHLDLDNESCSLNSVFSLRIVFLNEAFTRLQTTLFKRSLISLVFKPTHEYTYTHTQIMCTIYDPPQGTARSNLRITVFC